MTSTVNSLPAHATAVDRLARQIIADNGSLMEPMLNVRDAVRTLTYEEWARRVADLAYLLAEELLRRVGPAAPQEPVLNVGQSQVLPLTDAAWPDAVAHATDRLARLSRTLSTVEFRVLTSLLDRQRRELRDGNAEAVQAAWLSTVTYATEVQRSNLP